MSRRDDIMKAFRQYEEETERRINLGIELHRKGFGTVKVTDAAGNPLSGVKIRAKLKNHEFQHGANLFMLGELETEEKNRKYEEYFADCFNEATVPIYWSDLEPEDGKPRFAVDSPRIYRRPALDLCVEFCEKHGITPKAHCLTYVNFDPKWLNEYDINGVKRRIDRRYRELAERYESRIPAWEVVNETLCSRPERERTPYYETETFVEENFATAVKYFPYNELIINEASHVWKWDLNYAYNRSAYYQLVERAIRNGARIDAVGMQFHAFRPAEREAEYSDNYLYNPHIIYKVLDCYAKLGKPIQITEITIPAYRETKEDYELQAELLEKLYSIWFSHPAVEAAIYWNLPDGYAAFAPQGDMTAGENYYRGGLVDFNLNKKPAYDMLIELFKHRWTTDVTVETNENGEAKFLGFFGDYDLTVGDEKKKMKLSSKLPVSHADFVLR